MTSTEDQADFIVTPGSTPDSGKVTMDEAVTDFFEIETVVLNAAIGNSTSDNVTILGTGAGNEVTFTGSTTSAGDATVEVDNRAVVELENFDNDSTVVLDTGSGDDQIDITVNAATFFDNIDVLAGNPRQATR